jgi:hypothetical protein
MSIATTRPSGPTTSRARDVGGAASADVFLDAGYDLVVFEFVCTRAAHVERVVCTLRSSVPVHLLALWAPLATEREAVGPSVTGSVTPASPASGSRRPRGCAPAGRRRGREGGRPPRSSRGPLSADRTRAAYPGQRTWRSTSGSWTLTRSGRSCAPRWMAGRGAFPGWPLHGGWGWLGWAGGAILIAMGLLAVRSRTREALRYCISVATCGARCASPWWLVSC